MKKTLWTILTMAVALSAQAAFIDVLENGKGTTLAGWTQGGSGANYTFGITTNESDSSCWFSSSAYDCQLSQTVTIADYGITESALQGGLSAMASVVVWAKDGSDVCNVKVYELNASDVTLATHEVLNRAGENITSATTCSITFTLNSNTRKLKYELNGNDALNWKGYYGPKFRECALLLPTAGVEIDGSGITFDKDTKLAGGYCESPVFVKENTVAVMNIKRGVTLTVIGGDADAGVGAAPGIFVPESSTLYIVGDGKLVAQGGDAGNGLSGNDGNNGVLYKTGGGYGWGGNGGKGGTGGGGGAPAIGGAGGMGGDGGGGGAYGSTSYCSGSDYDKNGGNGSSGSRGADGVGMGKVVILGNLDVTVIAGDAASADGSGGYGGYKATDAGSGYTRDYASGGGGGGGGGARGQNAQYAIGGGGAGGAGGGGGGSGSTYCGDYDHVGFGAGGEGGVSYSGSKGDNGYSNGSQTNGGTSGGYGGSGGSANTTRGSNGTFLTLNCVTYRSSTELVASQASAQTSGSAVASAVTVTFKSDASTVVDTASATLMFAPPAAPAPGSKDGYVFLGYYTEEEGGTQIYDANRQAVYPVWQTVEDVTLYAHWLRLSTITFVSEGVTVDTRTAQKGNALPEAPATNRTDYAFTGYWTAASGGTMVYNADRVAVASVWDSTEDVTYYAQWRPVSVPFTVTLDNGGGSTSTLDVRQGDTIQPVTPPTKAAFKFTGYWTEAESGVKVFNADGSPVGSTWTYYADLTLYARWISAYAVTFVSVDATVGTATYSLNDTDATVQIPTRSGDYSFLGYYTDDGKNIFDETGSLVEGKLSELASETRLYAHWAPPEGSIATLVYRGQLNLLNGEPAVHSGTYTKKMHFRLYDGEEATTPLWKIDDQTVTVNKDGSFVHAFGDDNLAALLATGLVTHVGLAIGNDASTAIEMKPRRALRPVAAVNRALTAEGAALDIRIGNLVTENALVAADATVSKLEVAGRVTAPGAGRVSVTPLTIGPAERTKLLRGKGVKAFSSAKPTVLPTPAGAVLRGQELATAPSDGIALISSNATGNRALRCPAVIQYCREGEKVRAPTSDPGGLKVTFFPFVGKEGK